MELEFKAVELKEKSTWLEEILRRQTQLSKNNNPRFKMLNEFIIVGEENIDGEEYYKVNQLSETGLSIFGGLDLATIALTIPKKEFDWDGQSFIVLDVPKENLNIDIVDNIKRLN